MGLELRAAEPADAAFLTEMLLLAEWPAGDGPGRERALALPWVARWLDGWPDRPGDRAVVAERDGRPGGAAWCRRFRPEEIWAPMASPDVPELGIAVVPAEQGRGTGRALLRALIDAATAAGEAALDLNVLDGNDRAAALYRSEGFVDTGRCYGRWMRRALRPPSG